MHHVRQLRNSPLIESAPIRPDAVCMHMRVRNKLGDRNVISRSVENPHFVHFSFDPTGTYFVSDYLLEGEPNGEKSELVVGPLGAGPDAVLTIRPLIDPQASWKDQQSHPTRFSPRTTSTCSSTWTGAEWHRSIWQTISACKAPQRKESTC